MLRYLPLLLLLLLVPASADQVKSSKLDVVCTETKVLVDVLRDNLKELPVFVGVIADDIKFVLTANKESQTWTAFVHDPNSACVISLGRKFNLIRTNSI